MDSNRKMTADELAQRREERRRRRQRAQILAYCAVLVIVLVIAGLVVAATVLFSNTEKEPTVQELVESTVAEEQTQVIFEEESIEEPSVEAPVLELTPQQKLDEIVNAAIEVMPIEDKVAGLFVATPESITGVDVAVKAGEGTKNALAQYGVGGVIYSAKNIKDAAQFKEMLDNTKLYSKYPVFLAVDEKPGHGPLTGAKLIQGNDTLKTVGASGDVNVAFQAGQVLGANLAEYGINLGFSVYADCGTDSSMYGADNYFSSLGEVSGPLALAYTQGMEASGVFGAVGLFPGSGRVAKKSSDNELISTEKTAQEFTDTDFVAYQNLINGGIDKLMVGAYMAPGLVGENEPCCFSSLVVTDILRNQLGYKGIIFSDYLNQKSITHYFASDEAAVMALKAGCDMIVAPEDFVAAYNGILQAVSDGTISEERIDDALRRIYRVKFAYRVED